jgi:general secretion pathway protein L
MTTLRFDLKTQITWPGLVDAARRFLAWWQERLWEVLPGPLRAHATAAFDGWTAHLDGRTMRLRAASADHDDLVLDYDAADDELRARVAQLAPACLRRRVDVVIPPDQGLLRSVHLPAAAQQRLRSVIELQLDRLSPFRAGDVRFDCRSVDAPSGGEIAVEIGIVPRQRLREIEQRLGRLGIAVRRFGFDGMPFSFAPVEPRRTSHEKLQYVLAGIAAAAFLCAVVLTPILRAAEIDGLAADVGRLRGPAHQAVSLQDELRRAQAPLNAAASVLARPGALDILRSLTEILPADVQLTDLKIDGAAIRLSGYGSNAARLATLLRGSGRFAHVHLSGPVGKAADGRERFEIEMAAPAPRMRGAVR